MNCSNCGQNIDLSMVSDLWLKTRDEVLTADLDRAFRNTQSILQELRAVTDERFMRKYPK